MGWGGTLKHLHWYHQVLLREGCGSTVPGSVLIGIIQLLGGEWGGIRNYLQAFQCNMYGGEGGDYNDYN